MRIFSKTLSESAKLDIMVSYIQNAKINQRTIDHYDGFSMIAKIQFRIYFIQSNSEIINYNIVDEISRYSVRILHLYKN